MSVQSKARAASRHLVVSFCAKTRLDAAQEWLRRLPHDAEVLILAANAVAADAFVHAAVAASGSRFGIHRFTPHRLAARISAPELARRNAAPAAPLSLFALASRAAQRVVQQGNAAALTSVVQRPGFPQALARSYVDIREAGISTACLKASGAGSREIAPFIEAMDQERHDNRIADRAELYEIAIAAITDRGVSPAGLPLLLLDLPLDTATEQLLVAALVTRAPQVLATATHGDRAAIDALARVLQVSPNLLVGQQETGSLANLQRHLFEGSAPSPRPLDAGVSIASWPGETRECVELARLIQREAASGVPFDRMAVLLRAPALYRGPLEEALRRAGIPAWFARGTTRPDLGGRALLALLACAVEGLSARRFAEYLSLAQVPLSDRSPESVWTPPESDLLPAREIEHASEDRSDKEDTEEAPRAPWRWERLLTDAAVIGRVDRWRRRLAGLQQEIELRLQELAEDDARAGIIERQLADLEQLRTFALPLIEQLAELPRQALWGEWLSHLKELAVRALRDAAGVLEVITELEPLRPVGPVDLWNIQQVLSPRLRELRIPAEARPNGAVYIAPVEAARGLSFEVVFVPGLAEKFFRSVSCRIRSYPMMCARASMSQNWQLNRYTSDASVFTCASPRASRRATCPSRGPELNSKKPVLESPRSTHSKRYGPPKDRCRVLMI